MIKNKGFKNISKKGFSSIIELMIFLIISALILSFLLYNNPSLKNEYKKTATIMHHEIMQTLLFTNTNYNLSLLNLIELYSCTQDERMLNEIRDNINKTMRLIGEPNGYFLQIIFPEQEINITNRDETCTTRTSRISLKINSCKEILINSWLWNINDERLC